MAIDPKIEQPTRKMLGHAIRHELDDLAALMQSAGSEVVGGSVPLCLFVSAYVAVDVSDRWPTEADLREIAASAAQSATQLDITGQEIYDYLSRVVLGPDKLDTVFPTAKIITVPLFATANLLLTFCPHEKDWWEYLDQIWEATETADRTSLTVLPALILRAHNTTSRQAGTR